MLSQAFYQAGPSCAVTTTTIHNTVDLLQEDPAVTSNKAKTKEGIY
jgi:hypothetical protein